MVQKQMETLTVATMKLVHTRSSVEFWVWNSSQGVLVQRLPKCQYALTEGNYLKLSLNHVTCETIKYFHIIYFLFRPHKIIY